ncbi:MAG TPA: hypothetical protein VLT86_14015 [Vicinamibacterales bacterium]|nr:hypothetical protein [Vicinamibacterales bacterium]
MTKLLAWCLTLAAAGLSQASQAKPEPLDGPNRAFHDDLLDNLQGTWKAIGPIMGQPRDLNITAEWVLNHQFLLVHQKDAKPIEGKPLYEAEVYVGYDNASDRYVVHWIDIYGGRTSETLGYGRRMGNSILFVFEYPDGPFHNTFTWNAGAKTWRFLLEQKDATGKWTVFADQTVAKTK